MIVIRFQTITEKDRKSSTLTFGINHIKDLSILAMNHARLATERKPYEEIRDVTYT